jgi:membrane protease YdiL (CAAX protease family)
MAGGLQKIYESLFHNRAVTAFVSAALLLLIALLPPYGVIAGWLFLLPALLLCLRKGSFGEIGFRRPASWSRTLALGLVIGIAAQLAFVILIDPLLERLTGSPVDLSSLDGMRGNPAGYAIMLAVGWIAGGFLEEMLFRGYLLRRIQHILGDRRWAALVAIALTSIAFGMAHGYQDTAGMLSTGLMGALLGGLFVWARDNLWLPILVHGVTNTAGITLIYTSADRVLGQLVFS